MRRVDKIQGLAREKEGEDLEEKISNISQGGNVDMIKYLFMGWMRRQYPTDQDE